MTSTPPSQDSTNSVHLRGRSKTRRAACYKQLQSCFDARDWDGLAEMMADGIYRPTTAGGS